MEMYIHSPFSWLEYRHGSFSLLLKPFVMRISLNFLFHSLAPCFRPYKFFWSLQTICVHSPDNLQVASCRLHEISLHSGKLSQHHSVSLSCLLVLLYSELFEELLALPQEQKLHHNPLRISVNSLGLLNVLYIL